MECLLKFPVTLKNLGIEIVFETDNRSVHELPTILYKLLKKHSPTLEKLSIDICLPNYDGELEWKFPVFPALKRLRICNYSELHNLEWNLKRAAGQEILQVLIIPCAFLSWKVCIFPSNRLG